MSNKGTTNETAAPPASRGNAEPAYDLFDSLRQARLKSKQPRQASQSPDDNPLQDGVRRDVE